MTLKAILDATRDAYHQAKRQELIAEEIALLQGELQRSSFETPGHPRIIHQSHVYFANDEPVLIDKDLETVLHVASELGYKSGRIIQYGSDGVICLRKDPASDDSNPEFGVIIHEVIPGVHAPDEVVYSLYAPIGYYLLDRDLEK